MLYFWSILESISIEMNARSLFHDMVMWNKWNEMYSIHNVIPSKLIVINNRDRSYYISKGHIPIRMLHATLTMVFDSLTFTSQQQPIWQPYCKWGSLNKTLIDIGLPQVPYYTFVFSSVKLDICWASIHMWQPI